MTTPEYIYEISRKCIKPVTFQGKDFDPGQIQEFMSGTTCTSEQIADEAMQKMLREFNGDFWVTTSMKLTCVLPVNHALNPRRLLERMQDQEDQDEQ